MNELDQLDAIERVLGELPDDHSCHPKPLVDDGFRLTGALIIGQYTGPDGRQTAMVPAGIGNMNAWTQEGIHLWALRRIAAGDHGTSDDG